MYPDLDADPEHWLKVIKQSQKRRINYFLIDDERIRSRSWIRSRIRTCEKWIRMRIREAPKHTDPTDPLHC
jgi:hypothetical protein